MPAFSRVRIEPCALIAALWLLASPLPIAGSELRGIREDRRDRAGIQGVFRTLWNRIDRRYPIRPRKTARTGDIEAVHLGGISPAANLSVLGPVIAL